MIVNRYDGLMFADVSKSYLYRLAPFQQMITFLMAGASYLK